jgi:hypothetical protein
MKPFLIIDANAFIHNVDLLKHSQTYSFYSTFKALAEVKDT